MILLLGRFIITSDELTAQLHQLLLDLLRRAVEVLGNLHLLLVGQLIEHFAQLAVNHRFAGRVVGAVRVVVPAPERRGQIFHVELEVREEVDFLSAAEGVERVNAPVYRGVHDDFAVRGRELDLLDRGHHLPHVKTADLLHLKGRSVEVAVLPPELVRIGVVLEVLLRV